VATGQLRRTRSKDMPSSIAPSALRCHGCQRPLMVPAGWNLEVPASCTRQGAGR
jgi:hypothetical protein